MNTLDLLAVTASVWTNPVVWIAALLVVIEVSIFALGTWQVARKEDGWSLLALNPVRRHVLDEFAFHPHRADDPAAMRRGSGFASSCDHYGNLLDRLPPDHFCRVSVKERAELGPYEVLERFDWPGSVRSVFLHANLWHMALNVLAFLALAPYAVRRFGPVRFLFFFLAAGVVGNAAHWLVAGLTWAGWPLPGHDPFMPLVGASGAIFGLLAVLLRTGWRRARANGEPWTHGGALVWLLRAHWQLVMLNVVFGFLGPWSWEAHLGGFLAGWFAEPWLRRSPRDYRRALEQLRVR